MKILKCILFHIVGLMLAAVVIVLIQCYDCASEYKLGAGIPVFGLGVFALPLEFLLGTLIYFTVVVLCRISLLRGKVRLAEALAVGALSVLVSMGCLFFVKRYGTSPDKLYLDGMASRITNSVPIQEVMQWRQQLMALPANNEGSLHISKEHFPYFFSEFEKDFRREACPPDVVIFFDKLGKPCLADVFWASHFGISGMKLSLNETSPTNKMSNLFGDCYYDEWNKYVYLYLGNE